MVSTLMSDPKQYCSKTSRKEDLYKDVESFCEACESLSDTSVIGDKLMVIESTGAGVATVAKEYNLH